MAIQISPGNKNPQLAITVQPAGLQCAVNLQLTPVSEGAELVQGRDALFMSTGERQLVSLPIAVPYDEYEYTPEGRVRYGSQTLLNFYSENVVVTPSGIVLRYEGAAAWDVTITSYEGIGQACDLPGLKNPATDEQRAQDEFPGVRFPAQTHPFMLRVNEWWNNGWATLNYWYGPFEVPAIPEGTYTVSKTGLTGPDGTHYGADLAFQTANFTAVVVGIEYTGGETEDSISWGAVIQVTGGDGIFRYWRGATFIVGAGGGEDPPEELIGQTVTGRGYLERVDTGYSYRFQFVITSGGL